MTRGGEHKTFSSKKVESDWRQQGSDKMKKHNLKVETVLSVSKNKERRTINAWFRKGLDYRSSPLPRSLLISLMSDMSHTHDLGFCKKRIIRNPQLTPAHMY